MCSKDLTNPIAEDVFFLQFGKDLFFGDNFPAATVASPPQALLLPQSETGITWAPAVSDRGRAQTFGSQNITTP